MHAIRTALSYAAYPLILTVALGAFLLLEPTLGVDGAQLPSTLCAVLLMALLERLIPQHERWRRAFPETRRDWALNVVGAVIPSALVNALLLATLIALQVRLSGWLGRDLWPTSWPFAAQLALALVVGEFFIYWMHRALHTFPYLWRFHAVHHSAEWLNWLNANRVHPMETLIAYTPAFVVMMLLGCPPVVFGAWAVFAGVHGIMQHLNVKVRLGPLNYVFSSAVLHRWHHSRKRSEADSNYGSTLILWDIVFRTRLLPPAYDAPANVGIGRVPEYVNGTFLRLLIEPLFPARPTPPPSPTASPAARP